MRYQQFENFGALAAGTAAVTILQVEWEFLSTVLLKQIRLKGLVRVSNADTTHAAGYSMRYVLQTVGGSLSIFNKLPAQNILTGQTAEPIGTSGMIVCDNDKFKDFDYCLRLPPQKYRLSVILEGAATLNHYYTTSITLAWYE